MGRRRLRHLPACSSTSVSRLKDKMDNKDTDAKTQANSAPTAFLVDLVSNRKIPITTPRCRVGRDDLNDIVITGDQSISRFHFIINKEENQYSVQDAKSRHGTFLNGNQITGPEPINDGDVLKIGVSLFWFVIESPATAEGDSPKGEPEKAKIVLNPAEADAPASGATQDINQLEIIDKLTSLTEAAEAKDEKEDEKAEAEAKEEAAKKEAAEKEAAEKEAAEKEAAEKAAAEKEAAEKEAAEKEAAEKEAAEKEAAEKEAAEKEAAEKEAAEKEAAAKAEAEKEEAEKAKAKKEQEETSAKPDKKGKKGDKEEEKEDSSKNSESEKSDSSKEDEKDDEKSAEAESKNGEEPEVSVKDLLGPLHDEIAASRERDKDLIKDALDKADFKSESSDEIASQKDSETEEAKESEKEPEKEVESEPEIEAKKEAESEPIKAEDEKSEDEAVLSEKSSQNETLDRFADIIESSDSGKNAEEESKSSHSDSHEERTTSEISAQDSSHTSSSTRNGAEEMTIQGPSTVPDWCKRYFADELKGLNKELDELNDQIRKYQDKIKDIEGQASLTKGLRNTLLVSEGDELIEACKKVLSLIGWKVTQSDEDKNELLLEGDDQKVTIARVIWTNTNAERSHLGQLSISQTRYWCEKGKEPKGVLIVSKVSDKAPTSLAEESDEDFTDFASKKNVCLMSTLQLLSLYREAALKNTKNDELREAIYDSKGWLKGYKLEPGETAAEEPASKSLSSLLSS